MPSILTVRGRLTLPSPGGTGATSDLADETLMEEQVERVEKEGCFSPARLALRRTIFMVILAIGMRGVLHAKAKGMMSTVMMFGKWHVIINDKTVERRL